jgi:hypothetical protein
LYSLLLRIVSGPLSTFGVSCYGSANAVAAIFQTRFKFYFPLFSVITKAAALGCKISIEAEYSVNIMSHPMDNSSLPSESMEAKSSQVRDHKASISRFRKRPTIQRRLFRATSFGREYIVLTVVLVLSIVQWAFVICTWKASPAAVPGGEAHGLVPECTYHDRLKNLLLQFFLITHT